MFAGRPAATTFYIRFPFWVSLHDTTQQYRQRTKKRKTTFVQFPFFRNRTFEGLLLTLGGRFNFLNRLETEWIDFLRPTVQIPFSVVYGNLLPRFTYFRSVAGHLAWLQMIVFDHVALLFACIMCLYLHDWTLCKLLITNYTIFT